MSDDTRELQEAFANLLSKRRKVDTDHDQAVLVALTGLKAVMTEMIAQREDAPTPEETGEAAMRAAQIVADAIDGLRIELPPINLEPRFEVPQAAAPKVEPHITLPPMQPKFEVLVPEAPQWTTLRGTFETASDGRITGFLVTKE